MHLVTIDDPETMDHDDALHAVAHAEGWTLWVAIADPLPWLAAEPGLQKLAADRLGSIYLPGVEYPMLPTSLAHGEAALQADRPRPALRSEEHTSELQSRGHLVCRLLLEKKTN